MKRYLVTANPKPAAAFQFIEAESPAEAIEKAKAQKNKWETPVNIEIFENWTFGVTEV